MGGRLRHVTYSGIHVFMNYECVIASYHARQKKDLREKGGVTRNPKNGVLLRRVTQGVMSHMFLSQG